MGVAVFVNVGVAAVVFVGVAVVFVGVCVAVAAGVQSCSPISAQFAISIYNTQPVEVPSGLQ